jgi:hypothetical protein
MTNEYLPQAPAGEFLLFKSADGSTRVECRFEAETLWLSQASMAELYDKDVRTINEHLINIYKEGELEQNATIRKFRIVRQEGTRQVSREIEHYNLEAILAADYQPSLKETSQFFQTIQNKLHFACTSTQHWTAPSPFGRGLGGGEVLIAQPIDLKLISYADGNASGWRF